MVRLRHNWLEAMNNGGITVVLMVDLCKAFDLVDHSLLLQKLEIYLCTANALNWFTSYLFNRSKKFNITPQIIMRAKYSEYFFRRPQLTSGVKLTE